jgi:hypothetical protein
MEKIIINNYRWFYDDKTNFIYESENKKKYIKISDFTPQEQQQIYNYIHYNKPMINHNF